MDGRQSKTGAVGAAPETQSRIPKHADRTLSSYAQTLKYQKPVPYCVDGRTIRCGGGRARLLDMLIDAKPAGVDRLSTWAWCANIGDSIRALRQRGITIETRSGPPTAYVLKCDACRIGGGQ